MTPATACTFDPLNPESVDNIIATEKPDACVVQFGGQTAIKLAKHMDEIGLPILGTPADAIDEAEDRERFDELLERCKIPRAPAAPCSIWTRLWPLPTRSACRC